MTVPTSVIAPSRRRLWLFRIASIVLALTPLVLFELLCIACDWGIPDATRDPYVEFATIQPLFEQDDAGQRYQITPRRKAFFAAESFPVKKAENGVRIFCLGGSTVQGRPYSIETSFTKWLELALHEMDATVDWDVINCGGISYASYRLVPILEECLNYEPDLFILCTGHNEFLEDRHYATAKQRPVWVQSALATLNRLRTTNVAREFAKADQQKPVLSTEVQARLDFKNGLAKFHRDPDWARSVAEHFAANVSRMIQLARRHQVPILLVKPCSNLAGTPPFKTEPNLSLTEDQQQRVDSLLAQARALTGTDLQAGVESYQQAVRLDPLSARGWYELGQCHLSLNEYSSARTELVQARDLDICPLRMTTPLETAFTELAIQNDVLLLDAHELLESETQSGVLGDFWLVDHVHPSFAGHQKIALALAEKLRELGIVTLAQNSDSTAWQARAQDAFKAHFDALDRTYFHRGQRMLEALQGWTRGEAEN